MIKWFIGLVKDLYITEDLFLTAISHAVTLVFGINLGFLIMIGAHWYV